MLPPADRQADLDEALAVVRHDLKTPLCVIKGHAQLVLRDVLRAPGLSEEERARMLARLELIAAAADEAAARIDASHRNRLAGHPA